MKLIIVGPACSGKDTLKERLSLKDGFLPEVSYTTRPPREGEVDGVNYHYITNEEFETKIKAGFFLQYASFNGWYYGTSIDEFESKDIFIMSPPALKQIDPLYLIECLVVYLDIPEDLRRKRLEGRNDSNDSITRRLDADAADFTGLTGFDLKITNPDF